MYFGFKPFKDFHYLFPYKDFYHFTGRKKPWFKGVANNPPEDVKSIDRADHPNQIWYHVLRKINVNYNLKIDDLEKIEHKEPILGLFPTPNTLHLNTAQEADCH